MAKDYSADFSVDAVTLYDAVLLSVRDLGYKGDGDRAAGLLTFKAQPMRWWKGRPQDVSVVVAPVSESTAKMQVSIRMRGAQLFDWGERDRIAQRFVETVNSQLRQGQLQQRVASSLATEAGDTLHDMVCPKCGSADWRQTPGGLALFLTGLMMVSGGLWLTGFGLLLLILIIGIPILMAGLAMMMAGFGLMIVGPFSGTVFQCQRCKKAWKREGDHGNVPLNALSAKASGRQPQVKDDHSASIERGKAYRHWTLGGKAYRQGRPEDAITELDKASDLSRKHALDARLSPDEDSWEFDAGVRSLRAKAEEQLRKPN